MMQNPILEALSAAGVSVWLDDLSRDRLRSGSLQQLIEHPHCCLASPPTRRSFNT